MVKRRTLSREQVLDRANEMIASEGLNHLTIRALASQLDVRPQSIYNYVDSRDDLLDQVGLTFVNEIADRLMRRLVGVAGKEALWVFAHEFRAGCKQQQHLAPLLLNLNDLQQLTATHQALVDLYQQMFKSLHLDEAGNTALVASTLYRSALFGFIVQEIGGFLRLSARKIDKRFDQTMQLAIDQFSSLD